LSRSSSSDYSFSLRLLVATQGRTDCHCANWQARRNAPPPQGSL
jgi:hypothetical protein